MSMMYHGEVIADAAKATSDSEAYAVGTREGLDVTMNDKTYHNNAKYYAELAKQNASSSSSDSSSAEQYAEEAKLAENNAENYAKSALSHSLNAASAAEYAGESAASAAKSASQAEDFTTIVESYVHGGTGKRPDEDTDNGQYYMTETQKNASAAKKSENNADLSAKSAESSSTSASQKAQEAATSAETATQKASDAETSATEAEKSSELATQKATEAENSATAANTGATTATNKANEASDYANTAKSYAVGGTGTRIGEDTDNAKEYARQAQESAEKAAEIAGGDFIKNSEKGAKNGVATLDNTGKIPSEQIPDSVGSVKSVNGQTGEVSLSAGDVSAIPTSEKGEANGVATLGNDGKLTSSQMPTVTIPVTSVNSKTGDVTLSAKDVDAVATDGDTANNTVKFVSSDDLAPTQWYEVPILSNNGKETHANLFKKISMMFSNVRYLWKILGSTDISTLGVGDGTVTGAISSMNEGMKFPDGSGFYPDVKDGVRGYNTDQQRGADTFSPFSSGGGEVYLELYSSSNASYVFLSPSVKYSEFDVVTYGGYLNSSSVINYPVASYDSEITIKAISSAVSFIPYWFSSDATIKSAGSSFEVKKGETISFKISDYGDSTCVGVGFYQYGVANLNNNILRTTVHIKDSSSQGGSELTETLYLHFDNTTASVLKYNSQYTTVPSISADKVAMTSYNTTNNVSAYILISDFIDITRYKRIYLNGTSEGKNSYSTGQAGAYPQVYLVDDKDELVSLSAINNGLISTFSVFADIEEFEGSYKIAILFQSGASVSGYGNKVSTYNFTNIILI